MISVLIRTLKSRKKINYIFIESLHLFVNQLKHFYLNINQNINLKKKKKSKVLTFNLNEKKKLNYN